MVRTRLGPDHQQAVKPRRQAGRPGVARVRRRSSLGLGLVCWTFLRAAVGLEPSAVAPRSLAPTLTEFLAAPAFARATWGIEVADVATGRTLFATNAHRLLKPGSNGKLFTAALALDRLGPDFRFTTRLLLDGTSPTRGTLKGDLVVLGGGDFSFAARFHQGDPAHSLDRVVDLLVQAGIRRVTGDVIADDALFAADPFGSGWTWDDLQYYFGAEVSALSVDDNAVDLVFHPGSKPGDAVRWEASPATPYLTWRTRDVRTGERDQPAAVTVTRAPGSREVQVRGVLPAGGKPWKDAVSVPEPAAFFAFRLREALQARGIAVGGRARHEAGAWTRRLAKTPARAADKSATDARRRVLETRSAPLRELLPAMLKASQNLYAQLLLLHVGLQSTTAPGADESQESRGLQVLGEFLERVRVPRNEVLLTDGAGLSRTSLATPHALVSLLRVMDQHPQGGPFLEGLPVAGVDGTLRSRMQSPPLLGNLRGKTGSLRFVSTLSGFVTNTAGRRLVFSLLLNAYEPGPGEPSGRAAIDSVARLIAESPDTPP